MSRQFHPHPGKRCDAGAAARKAHRSPHPSPPNLQVTRAGFDRLPAPRPPPRPSSSPPTTAANSIPMRAAALASEAPHEHYEHSQVLVVMTDNGISGLEMCPPWAPALGFAGATLALVFTCVGSAYGTGKAAQGISAVGVSKPEVRAQPHTLTALRTRDTVSRVLACCCLVLSRRAVPRLNEEPPCSPEPRQARPSRQPACYLPPLPASRS